MNQLEIHEVRQSLLFELGTHLTEAKSVRRFESRNLGLSIALRIIDGMLREEAKFVSKERPTVPPYQREKECEDLIESLPWGMGTRVENAVWLILRTSPEVRTLNDLAALSDKELLGYKGIGKNTVEGIRWALEEVLSGRLAAARAKFQAAGEENR